MNTKSFTNVCIIVLDQSTVRDVRVQPGRSGRGRGRGCRGRSETRESVVQRRGRGRGCRGRSETRERAVQRRRGRSRGRQTTSGRSNSTIIPWKKTQLKRDVAPPSIPLGEVPGPHLDLSDDPQPVDYLRNFIDLDVLVHIVDETNR